MSSGSRPVLLALALVVVAGACDRPADPVTGGRPANGSRTEALPPATLATGPTAEPGVPARAIEADVSGVPEVVAVLDLSAPIAAGPVLWGERLIVATPMALVAYADPVGSPTGRPAEMPFGTPAWSVALGAVPRQLAAGTTGVFLADDRSIARFSPTDGGLVWSAPLPAAPSARLTVTGRSVYVGTVDGRVTALDPENGALRWTIDVGQPVRDRMVLLDGVIYLATERNVVAVDPEAGTRIWTHGIGRTESGPVMDRSATPPRLVVQPVDGSAVAIAPATGVSAGVGREEPAGSVPALAAPLVWAGRAVVARADGEIASLPLESPDTAAWRYRLDGHLAGVPVRIGAVGLFGDSTGSLHAVDLASGELRGRVALPSPPTGEAVWRAGRLFIGTRGGQIVQVSVDGERGALPLFSARGSWVLPTDGRFRLRDSSASIRMRSPVDALYDVTVRSEPAGELLIRVVDAEGAQVATNMGMIRLSDHVRVLLRSGEAYLLSIERVETEGEVLVVVESRRID